MRGRLALLVPLELLSQVTYTHLKQGRYTLDVIAVGPGEKYTAATQRFKT